MAYKKINRSFVKNRKDTLKSGKHLYLEKFGDARKTFPLKQNNVEKFQRTVSEVFARIDLDETVCTNS